jgi:hypothetical protein
MKPTPAAHPQARGPLPKAGQDVSLKARHLRNQHLRVLAVLGQALHHRAEQRLGQPGGAVERLLDGQRSSALRTLDLSPEFVKEQENHLLKRPWDCLVRGLG